MSPASGVDPVGLLATIVPAPAPDVVGNFATVFAGLAPTAFEPQIETSVNASPGESMPVAAPFADGAAPEPAPTTEQSLKASAVFAPPMARVDTASPDVEAATGTIGAVAPKAAPPRTEAPAVVRRGKAVEATSTPMATDGPPPVSNGDQRGGPDDVVPKALSDAPLIDIAQIGVAPIAIAIADPAPSLPERPSAPAVGPVPATISAEQQMSAQAAVAMPNPTVAASQPAERARLHVRGDVEQAASTTTTPTGQRPDFLRADPLPADVAPVGAAPPTLIVAAEPRIASASFGSVRTMTDTGHADPVIRTPGFTVQLDQIARDLVVMSGDRDMRFNVRPEALGQVSVTIGRGDDGPTLRLGVENQTAMQAARAAEPLLTDVSARNGTPFAQVTIDMSAHDQRGRSARAAVLLKRGQATDTDNNIQHAPVKTGRFA